MSVSISVPANLYDRLHAHLLPPDSPAEQAAFLFAKSTTAHGGCRFEVIDHVLIDQEGIEYHSLVSRTHRRNTGSGYQESA